MEPQVINLGPVGNFKFFNRVPDTYVAPGFSKFTAATIPDLTDHFPGANNWIPHLFLTTIFRGGYVQGIRQGVVAFLRRSRDAYRTYQEARRLTLAYLDGVEPGRPRIGEYYDAVAKWEHLVIDVTILADIFSYINSVGCFEKGDGSAEQRIYDIGNKVKHIAGSCRDGTCPEDHSVPLWLSNDGLHSFGLSATYAEVAAVVNDFCRVADLLQDPYTIKERYDAIAAKDAAPHSP